jgi:hypothetical protein
VSELANPHGARRRGGENLMAPGGGEARILGQGDHLGTSWR